MANPLFSRYFQNFRSKFHAWLIWHFSFHFISFLFFYFFSFLLPCAQLCSSSLPSTTCNFSLFFLSPFASFPSSQLVDSWPHFTILNPHLPPPTPLLRRRPRSSIRRN
ncbi:unnamed protein product [Cuscuta epithymum]|uniref:Uncharacterized protein n=1 Tax=Cuscuta epithymum TaxID=186058 RepID=A0AAV0DG35_9ASTE|nr:unnamed protein product [Cuscuta epithymum]